MKSPLHILHLEDDPNDAALVQSILETEGIPCATVCVHSHDDFVAALDRGGIDLILSDYSMPGFDGLTAAKIVRTKWPHIPLIFISGTLGEERAVDSLKSGATDYVLKSRLGRLVPAVRRAMQEAEGRAKNERTEKALKESEQRLHVIFIESPMGIALVGMDGRPVLTNPALERMLGYTGEELCRMPFNEFTHPEDRARGRTSYQQLIQGACQGYQIEERYIRKDGEVVWARLSVTAAREASGHAEFAIAMVEDITKHKEMVAQAIESQKMDAVGQMASGVAHDFNNILAVIMGYSDLAMQKLGADNVLNGYLETILSAAERGTGLTRQLLIFSRKQTVQPVVLRLDDAVKKMHKMLLRLINENIAMTIVAGEQTGSVKADSGYIGQVLMNLVVNARDAMPNGGKITIATTNVALDESHLLKYAGIPDGNYVMLSVTDTGTGMTDEVKARLFEAFFTTKPLGEGTGLGLSTCKTIVQQSGGHIIVESKVGQGTTFKIFFPRVEQPLDGAAKMEQAGPLPRGTETVLIVEDDEAVRHLARDILAALGYDVIKASNGQDALEVARQHKGPPIRLVITDVIMPLMDGKVMADELKITYPDTRILFTSGYTDDAIAHHGVLETGVDFLPKPYAMATLANKVREMLDQPLPPSPQKSFSFPES